MSYIKNFCSLDKELFEQLKKIKLLICDVDGVLTDGLIYMGNEGEELKAFHVRDGYGIHAIRQIGIATALITGRKSNIVENRAKTLNIDFVYQGQSDKSIAFDELCLTTQLRHEEIAYIGDDLIDLPVMDKVGFSVAVADAHPLVIAGAKYTTHLSGGKGAVREICDLFLFVHNQLLVAKGFSV